MRKLLAAAALSVCCQACAHQLYQWGDYDKALYDHYKQPQDRVTYVERLQQVIQEARSQGGTAPPGVQAEYGQALWETGNATGAIEWFKRESADWPESRVLMEKMIRNAQRQPATPGGA